MVALLPCCTQSGLLQNQRSLLCVRAEAIAADVASQSFQEPASDAAGIVRLTSRAAAECVSIVALRYLYGSGLWEGANAYRRRTWSACPSFVTSIRCCSCARGGRVSWS